VSIPLAEDTLVLIPPEGGELGAILNFWFTYNHDSNSMQLEVWPHFYISKMTTQGRREGETLINFPELTNDFNFVDSRR
jgi:hypothetical protein